MPFSHLVIAERRLNLEMPPCPACGAVIQGVKERKLPVWDFIPRNPARSTREDGMHVNAAIITFRTADDKLHAFSIHLLRNYRYGTVWTKLCQTTLLTTAGAFYFINVTGPQPPALLIASSSDLLGGFFVGREEEPSISMGFPWPVRDNDTFPYGKAVENWGAIPI
ncbi:MAG TPA: hypothetical protein VG102_00080 [Candidatus Paceibacterota bacterium]|jgi:hypothetical protein|nr:hypothetical protein [Candidatus Paceibacterota bacterium]